MIIHPKHILLLFLDGVGIGKMDDKHNPFLVADIPILKKLLKMNTQLANYIGNNGSESSFKPINATLGVSGLPQSGTGQSALLTGINTAKKIGKHFGPHLYTTLKPIVAEENIFRKLSSNGKDVMYANAFPKQYFDYLESPRYRITAIVHAWLSSGFKLNDSQDLKKHLALSADITNERWHQFGYPEIPIITPKEGGKRLVKITENYNFVLFEYYFTDHVGHSQSMKEAVEVLQTINGFLEGILDNLNQESTLFILTSDHGNVEDLSFKSHTRNPIPLVAIGKNHEHCVREIKKITDIAPMIIKMLT